ncbi:hypothetical protein CUJ83_07600 [Methanocella sp. CWC-04]|uniref:Uncharacterized protein n=2 Tax=Methanooceanicella nereidis TaxID=2052831 RepID=A0AAP2RDM2_9EURY|nr:hypothetical protein [Methanocella sp. CWC-04]
MVTAAILGAIWILFPGGIPEVDLLLIPGSQDDMAGENISLTEPSSMLKLLPVPPNGWSLDNSTGSYADNYPQPFTFACGNYTKKSGNGTVNVLIYDSGGKGIIWNSIFNTGFIYDNADGHARTYFYKDLPAWETAKYGPGGNVYSMHIKLDERFGIAITLKNATDSSSLREFADRINIYGIRALGK